MLCMGAPNYSHHKRTKSGTSRKSDEQDYRHHSRTTSTASTLSRCSTTSHPRSAYDPLSLHPPLSLGMSPLMPACSDFNTQPRLRSKSISSNESEGSPSKAEVSRRRTTHVYDRALQWPLRSQQLVPSGLADMRMEDVEAYIREQSQPTNHRRPSRAASEFEILVRRGAWKRRGIVFHLDPETAQQQEEHFELPEGELELPDEPQGSYFDFSDDD